MPKCQVRMKIITFIEDEEFTEKILSNLLGAIEEWIKALEAGRNPFDKATLEALRKEE